MRKENIERTYATWNELSLERKQKEIEIALDNDILFYSFSDQFCQEYLLDLESIQEKHGIDLNPIYTSGSQHGLLGFEFENENVMWYKDIQFWFEKYELKVDFLYNVDDSEKNKKIKEALQKKVNEFIKDFHKMYKYYKEFFMYGNCDQYKEYVKDQLEYNEDYEYLIEEKVVE